MTHDNYHDLRKANHAWSVEEVERALAEYERLKNAKVRGYPEQVAERMGVTQSRMTQLFRWVRFLRSRTGRCEPN